MTHCAARKEPMTVPYLADRQLLDAAPDAMVVIDPSGVIVLVNRQTEILFGYQRDELLGQAIEILLPERYRNSHAEHRDSYFSAPGVRAMGCALDLSARRKDGSEFPAEISLSPVESKQCVFVAGAIRDVTKRQAFTERKFREIFEQRHEVSGIVDLNGRLTHANEKALQFSGLKRCDVIGQKFWKTTWWSHDPKLQQKLQSAIERACNGEVVSFEATHPRPDGSLADVDFSIRPVKDEDGTILFLVPESRDATRRKVAEEALVTANADLERRISDRIAEVDAARKDAEHANAVKSRFLAAASHDLRQPLQSLSLYLSVLTRQLRDSNQLSISRKMRKSLETMMVLLDALLDISKLDSGAVVPERRDVRLRELLDRIVVDNIQQADDKGLQLASTVTDCVINTDPGLLERVLENLVTNAIRYTDEGSVMISCQRDENNVHIFVTDTGIGIPEDDLDKVFDEYYRLDNDGRDRRKGLGLGLTIVKQITQLLDHPIAVKSVPGKGSTFALTVPRGNSVPDSKFTVLRSRSARKREPVVILVDDDPSIVDATTMLLESEGIRVFGANGGDGALLHVKDGVRPDAIISDYRLPGCNGVEVVRLLRQAIGDDIPSVLMTGDTSAQAIYEANVSNCAVLHKPADTEHLISLIEDICV